MISITTVIQTHLQTQADSVVSGMNRFINFLTSVHGDTRRETQFLKVYADHNVLTPPLQCTAHLVMFKIFVSRDLKNPTTSFNGPNPILNSRIPNSNLNYLFFKILKFSGQSLPSMTSSILQPHFLSGGLLQQMVIVISFVHECKTVPNDYAPGLKKLK